VGGNNAVLLCAVALAGIAGFGSLGAGMDTAIGHDANGKSARVSMPAHRGTAAPAMVVSTEAGICVGPCEWVKDNVIDRAVGAGEAVFETATGVDVDVDSGLVAFGIDLLAEQVNKRVLSPFVDGLAGEGCNGFNLSCALGRAADIVAPDEFLGPTVDFLFEQSSIFASHVADRLGDMDELFDFAGSALDRVGLGPLGSVLERLERGLGFLEEKLGEYAAFSDEWSGRCTMDLGIDIAEQQTPPPNRSGGTRYTTFNQANGRSPCFRKGSMRTRQAEYLSQFESDVLAFQEVDFHNQRSGGVNTALEVIRKMHPAFNAFLDEERYVEVGPGGTCPPVAADRACMQHLADGSTIYRTTDGSLVFGPASEKPNIGDSSDVNFSALGTSPFGNATFIAEDHQLTDAYTVNFAPPDFPEGSKPIWDMSDAELAERNRRVGEAAEDWGATESRAAMVTTIVQPDGTVQTVFNVHLGGRSDGMAYKAAELQLLAHLIRHERSLGREVVLLGDCNVVGDAGAKRDGSTYKQRRNEERLMDTFLASAGLKLAGGGEGSGVGTIDQVWVSDDQVVTQHDQYGTGGTSDHRKAVTVTTE
jgi:endonuclease/exonuclease/phosphatase family metal-dependent hydrolase